ncbi:MAG: hypothetical protein FD180_920 [Planctomycetota bacterium]|nr:MAG: hypothetical protein FD180_920 [Planctomycetota bacterium]
MTPRRTLAIVALLALLGGVAWILVRFSAGGAGTDRPAGSFADRKHVLKVLFIGNSYTYVNDLPGTVEALAKASGQDPRLQVQGMTAGGATLQVHWDSNAAAAIRDTDWNYVVLQEQSLTPLSESGRDTLFFPYARKFHEVIQARGAKSLFYMTWKWPDSKTPQESLTQPYLDITRELGAQVAPAGMALELVLKRNPEFQFYADKGGHPTPAGTYLVACTFFAAIYDKSPVGLPATVTTAARQPVGVLPEDAPLVQGAAWEAVEAAKARLKSK